MGNIALSCTNALLLHQIELSKQSLHRLQYIPSFRHFIDIAISFINNIILMIYTTNIMLVLQVQTMIEHCSGFIAWILAGVIFLLLGTGICFVAIIPFFIDSVKDRCLPP